VAKTLPLKYTCFQPTIPIIPTITPTIANGHSFRALDQKNMYIIF